MSLLGIILIVFLLLVLFGGFSGWGGSYGYGFGNIGIDLPGILLVILIILLLTGRL